MIRRLIQFNPIEEMLANPHYRSGAIVARFCTYMATWIWGIYAYVDSRDGVVDGASVPPYQIMLEIMPLWVWTSIAASLATVQLIRLYRHATPRWFGTVINALFAFFWLFVAVSRVSYSGPGTACIAVVAWMALCAFVSNPLRKP